MIKEKDKLEALSSRLMTLEDAAVLMKIEKGTLQNWLSKGCKLKRVKVGGKTFIDRSKLEAYLQDALTGKQNYSPQITKMDWDNLLPLNGGEESYSPYCNT